MNNTTYVTIPCHRAYLSTLVERCLPPLLEQVDPAHVVVVANGPNMIYPDELPTDVGWKPYFGEHHIGRWWNLGLDVIGAMAGGFDHEVLVLNADAVVGPDLVNVLRVALRHHGLAMVGPDVCHEDRRHLVNRDGYRSEDRGVWVNQTLQSFPKTASIPGFCHMLRGELGLRYDPAYPGWYGDDDLEWEARRRGGTGLVLGATVAHEAGGFGGAYAEYGLRFFREKWGHDPWT